MLKIFLVRHGQNKDNLAKILNGHRDESLTEKGIEQAHDIAQKIKETGIVFDAVLSSPLQRAFETAKIISETIGAPQPIKEPLLIERNFGIMTGKNESEIEKICAPDIIKANHITYFLNPVNGEDFPNTLKRSREFLDKIQSQYVDGNILCVTHGDIGKMIYAEYYHLDWKTILTQFHFGNCDMLQMSKDSHANEAHFLEVIQ